MKARGPGCTVSVRIPARLYERLKAQARREGVTPEHLLVLALRRVLPREPEEAPCPSPPDGRKPGA